MRTCLGLLAVLVACAAAPAASATTGDEQALAARYAPVVRLVEHTGCPPGKPYLPIDVNLLFDESTVALRGPWGNDLVKIAPSAKDLAGLFEYHLDFPGSALDPGCSYLTWERRLVEGSSPTVYAHLATDPARPGKLALQYWLFYVFNDWNNLHEGDWEMVQLDFDAPTAADALKHHPVQVGYSQHEGAERAAWGDEKLELLGGTHPVVHPAAGSHANFYGESLYLGSSASEGVGCDDTRGPTFDVRPVVRTIPSDPQAAAREYPWIGFEGRWGELRPAFFNGPTGPNLKEQWTEPITWSEGWRDRSYTVPGGSVFGTNATDFFCGAVGRGSSALVRLVDQPLVFTLVLAAIVLFLIFLLTRTRWRPRAPLHLARRRSWGQILSASGRMYATRFRLLAGIGVVFIPILLLVSLLQALVLHATSIFGVQTSGGNGPVAFVVLVVGTSLTLLGLGIVQAATARALVEVDAGRPTGVIHAYRLAADIVVPLLVALVIASILVSLLASSFFLIPVAIWLAGRWCLIAPVVELEGAGALAGLRRSGRLVRGHWLKVASLIVIGGGLALVAGPLIGAVLILVTGAPFWLVNVTSGFIYAITMPFVAVTTVYVYFDARVRTELETEHEEVVLPAEITLAP
ncbi:MAG TPA: hypothetical protein VFK62_03110 [Gaiellaceae bacterium]|nr:hypothetical protein [Gaiellaceae bacterium]